MARARRLALLALPLVLPGAARAQVAFAIPSVAPDLSRYTTVEQCLAAAIRLRDSTLTWGPAVRDSSAYDPAAPLPEAATRAAAACSAVVERDRAAVDTIPVGFIVQLLLQGQRDSAAAALVRRRVALVPAAEPARRADVLVDAVRSHLRAQPVRAAAAAALTAEADRYSGGYATQAHVAMLYYAHDAMDTAVLRREIERYLTARERHVEVAIPRFEPAILLAPLALRDSSTTGYFALARSVTARADGRPFPAGQPGLVGLLGRSAPPLAADYWYRRADSASRPARGRVSLVVFVDHDPDSCFQCAERYAVLRRLAQRFPALDVTLESAVLGWFRLRPPTSEPAEADDLKKYYLDDLRLPGALALSTMHYDTLPAPDGRRVPHAPEVNRAAWDVPPYIQWAGVFAYVVDRDGTVVAATELTRTDERAIGAIIDALLTGPGHAAGTH